MPRATSAAGLRFITLLAFTRIGSGGVARLPKVDACPKLARCAPPSLDALDRATVANCRAPPRGSARDRPGIIEKNKGAPERVRNGESPLNNARWRKVRVRPHVRTLSQFSWRTSTNCPDIYVFLRENRGAIRALPQRLIAITFALRCSLANKYTRMRPVVRGRFVKRFDGARRSLNNCSARISPVNCFRITRTTRHHSPALLHKYYFRSSENCFDILNPIRFYLLLFPRSRPLFLSR